MIVLLILIAIFTLVTAVVSVMILVDLEDFLIRDINTMVAKNTKINTNVFKIYMAAKTFIKKTYGINIDDVFDACVAKILEEKQKATEEDEDILEED